MDLPWESGCETGSADSDEHLQNSNYRKDLTVANRKHLSWLHFKDEQRFHERHQVLDQQSYIPISLAYLT